MRIPDKVKISCKAASESADKAKEKACELALKEMRKWGLTDEQDMAVYIREDFNTHVFQMEQERDGMQT